MIGFVVFIVFIVIAVISMVAISMKVETNLRNQNYISGVRYGKVVQQLQDKHELHRFGFAQYFRRQFGELSIFSISMNAIGIFPIILLLLAPIMTRMGLSMSLYIFAIVGFIFILIVALIAQYLSSQPTAGGMYHIALLRRGTWLATIVGGFQIITQISMLVGYSYGFVYLSCILFPSVRELLVNTSNQEVSIMYWLAIAVVIVLQGGIAWFKSSMLPSFHTIALFIQGSGIVILLIAVFQMLRGDVYNGMHLFYINIGATDWFPANQQLEAANVGVAIALACRMFVGGEGSSHVAEETIEPRIRVSWSTLMSTCYSYIIGLVLLLLLAIVYMNFGLGQQNIFGLNWLMLLREQASTIGFVFIAFACVSCWLSSSTILQVSARLLMSMARDGILPWKNKLAQLSYYKQSPQYAIMAIQCISLVFVLMLYVVRTENIIVMTSLITIISHAIMLVFFLYFIPLETKHAIWRLEEWSAPLRYISMLVLVAIATAAATALTSGQLLIIFVPVAILVCYALIKHGFKTKLLVYDASSKRDLFEAEGKIPLQ